MTTTNTMEQKETYEYLTEMLGCNELLAETIATSQYRTISENTKRNKKLSDVIMDTIAWHIQGEMAEFWLLINDELFDSNK